MPSPHRFGLFFGRRCALWAPIPDGDGWRMSRCRPPPPVARKEALSMKSRIALALGLALTLAATAASAETKKGAAAPAAAGGDPVVARVNNTELHRSDVI